MNNSDLRNSNKTNSNAPIAPTAAKVLWNGDQAVMGCARARRAGGCGVANWPFAVVLAPGAALVGQGPAFNVRCASKGTPIRAPKPKPGARPARMCPCARDGRVQIPPTKHHVPS